MSSLAALGVEALGARVKTSRRISPIVISCSDAHALAYRRDRSQSEVGRVGHIGGAADVDFVQAYLVADDAHREAALKNQEPGIGDGQDFGSTADEDG